MYKKWNVVYKKECYSALKRKGILTQAITWMSLEDIILSEIRHAQKDKYFVILPL